MQIYLVMRRSYDDFSEVPIKAFVMEADANDFADKALEEVKAAAKARTEALNKWEDDTRTTKEALDAEYNEICARHPGKRWLKEMSVDPDYIEHIKKRNAYFSTMKVCLDETERKGLTVDPGVDDVRDTGYSVEVVELIDSTKRK